MALRPLNPRSQRYIRFPRRRSRLMPLLWFGGFCLTVWLFYGIVSFLADNNESETFSAEAGYAEDTATLLAEAQFPQDTPLSNAEVAALAARQYRAQNSALSATPQPDGIDVSSQEDMRPQSPASGQKSVTRATRRLHNGVSWNIPYVGFKLDEIAADIQKKYPALRAGKLEFQPAGVQSTIPGASELPGKNIALTINGCGPFGADEALLSLLKKERIPTTFFLSSTWIVKHKQDFTTIEKEPLFSIQGHGKNHLPLSLKGERVSGVKGTDSLSAILHEVEGNIRHIQRLTSKRPQWFRAAFNMYDKAAMSIVSHELNLPMAGYSLDANAATAEAITANLLKAQHGDIIMVQFTNGGQLAEALALAIPRLKSQGVTFIPLALLAGKK